MRILAARSALPAHSYPQAEITEAFAVRDLRAQPRPARC